MIERCRRSGDPNHEAVNVLGEPMWVPACSAGGFDTG
jgi:hypothetical protein